jgi:hypothetical protein
LLQRCVYVDKDLVLPAMAATGVAETFYVVASTDMERVPIMMARIQNQIGALAQLKASGTVHVTAKPILLESAAQEEGLEQQVQRVTDRVTEMVMLDLGCKPSFTTKEKNQYAN